LEDGSVIFGVEDTGPGIPEDQKQIMSDQFRQMTLEDVQVQPGFGLGLAFCKLATDAMDGRIWVQSELGLGSTFYIAFPVKEISEHEVETP
jgi:signal transduction histidine kinase